MGSVIPSSILDAHYSFTEPQEGTVPFLYNDSKWMPTCGIGFMVPNKQALREFSWIPNVQDAEADLVILQGVKETLQSQGAPPPSAQYYRSLTHARLDPASIREKFDEKVYNIRKRLVLGWNINAYPLPVQVALVDMAFNLGLGGLDRYVSLKAAVQARDWKTAAQECSRRGVQASRNEATKNLFLTLV